MSSVAVLDLQREPPSAFALARASRPSKGLDPWDPSAGMKRLDGLSGLMVFWTSLYEAGRLPGEELREALLRRWSPDSYEGELVARALQAADQLDHPRLVKEETRHLKVERAATADPGEQAFYDLLLSCLTDLRKIDRVKASGGSPAFLAHPDSLDHARWTLHNLLRFLQAHWALRRVHIEIARLVERRLAALRRLSGVVEGTGDLADRHDELE